MKKALLPVFLFFWLISHGQSEFVIDKKGLSPRSFISASGINSSDAVMTKIDTWFALENKKFKKTQYNKTDSSIQFTSIVTDVRLRKDKAYYIRYDIELSISNSKLLFKVLKIDLKQNSRFDMGWKELNLDKPHDFFKKIKGNKKAFLNKVAEHLNDLKIDLEKSLK